MTDRMEAQVRETGSLIVTSASTTKKRRVEAYIKAEEEQWNTKEERNNGENRWPNVSNITIDQGTENEQDMGPQWSEYCKRLNRQCEKKSDPMGTKGKEKNEKNITPTCPPHPVGSSTRPEKKKGREEKTWVRVIRDWGGAASERVVRRGGG